MGDEILTEEELCEWLKISRATAWRWRQQGMPYLKFQKALRFEKSKIQEWLGKFQKEN